EGRAWWESDLALLDGGEEQSTIGREDQRLRERQAIGDQLGPQSTRRRRWQGASGGGWRAAGLRPLTVLFLLVRGRSRLTVWGRGAWPRGWAAAGQKEADQQPAQNADE